MADQTQLSDMPGSGTSSLGGETRTLRIDPHSFAGRLISGHSKDQYKLCKQRVVFGGSNASLEDTRGKAMCRSG